MPEPTKDDLRKEIATILKDANLEETAAKKVRLQLEANLKCDLSARKKEVDDLVMEYVNAQDESGEEDEEDDDEEEEEESPKKNSKKPAAKKKAASDDEEDEEEEDSEDDKKKKGKRGAPAKRSAPAKKKKRGSDSEEESEGEDASDDDYKPNKGAKGKKGGAGRKKKGSDSDSDEDWKKSKPKAKKAATPGAKKGKGTGFTRPYNLSPELAAICGAEALPRHEVVKKVWTIIKERNLYDPKNKQYAICDSELQKVIGVKRFRTFGMLKYLKPHFLD